MFNELLTKVKKVLNQKTEARFPELPSQALYRGLGLQWRPRLLRTTYCPIGPMPYLALKNLAPVADEENPDGRQEAEDEDGPVELLVEHRGREEVAEHDDEDDARDHVHQDLAGVRSFLNKLVPYAA